MTSISDNFNRADNPISLGSSSEGWSWTAVDGVWGILSNNAIETVTGGNFAARAEIDLATDAQFSQLTIVAFAGPLNVGLAIGGPCTRFSAAAKTFYSFLWRASTGQYQFFKCVAGAFTLLGTGGSASADGDVVKITSDAGNQHTGFRNGAINMVAVSDSSITGNKRTGMIFNRGGVGQPTYDDFSAADLSNPPPASSVYVSGSSMVQQGTSILLQGTTPLINKGTVRDQRNVIIR